MFKAPNEKWPAHKAKLEALRKSEAQQREMEARRTAWEKTPEGIAALEKAASDHRESERLENERRAAYDAEQKEIKARPQRERAAKVAAYQLEQAQKGLPSFQIEVAKRYMRGDGLPQDDVLARFWLESACTNRESEATNLLKALSRR